MLEIVLTRDDANSDSALLVEWLVGDREDVRKGQAVCAVETSKASFDLEAPGDGTLIWLARAGDEVEIGGSVALVAESDADLADADAKTTSVAPAAAPLQRRRPGSAPSRGRPPSSPSSTASIST